MAQLRFKYVNNNNNDNNNNLNINKSRRIFSTINEKRINKIKSILLTISIIIQSLSFINLSFGLQNNQQQDSTLTTLPAAAAAVATIQSKSNTNDINNSPSTLINTENNQAINLIPVDQPILTNDDNNNSNHKKVLKTISPIDEQNNFLEQQNINNKEQNLKFGQIQESQVNSENDQNQQIISDSSIEIANNNNNNNNNFDSYQGHENSDDLINHNLNIENQKLIFNEPKSVFDNSYLIPIKTIQKQNSDKQISSLKLNQQQQQQQNVERRFGLFKKGSQSYGSSMSANYAISPFMTDCERCLASLGAGGVINNGQQNADLQQLDALPPPPPPPIPQATLIPAQPTTINQQQPFGPLKNKLFMKFPFFMKPISFSGDNNHDSIPYWPTQYQPSIRPQLFIRPAAAATLPAYNCIQATPPIIQASTNHHLHNNHHNNQEIHQFNTKSTKQYPQQQTTYSSSSY